METIKSWIKEAIVGCIWRSFTKANLRTVLHRIVTTLKEKAAQTENFADDWIVEFLESIVNSDAKIAMLWEHISVLFNADDHGLVVSTIGAEALAEGLIYHAEPTRECAAINIGLVVQLLNVVVPILVEWFQRKKETEGTVNAA